MIVAQFKHKTSVELRVLEFIRKHPKTFFSVQDIIQYVTPENNPLHTRRMVKKLVDGGQLYSSKGPNGTLFYTSNHKLTEIELHKYAPPKTEVKSEPQETVEIPRIDVHARSVRSLLKGWSQEKWNPKIFHSAQYLPLSIARLFELLTEVMYGSTVSKSDLAEVKANLQVLKRDLIATSSTVISLLEKEELWDPDKFFEFLLSEDAPPVDLLKDYVHKLKENYK